MNTLASGIVIAPARLSELSIKAPNVVNRYLAPNKREAPVITSLDFAGTSFPSLGSPVETSPKKSLEFKQTILNLIAKDEMNEAERNRDPQLDPLKMSDKELHANGFVILRLRNANKFNESINSEFPTSLDTASPIQLMTPVSVHTDTYEEDYEKRFLDCMDTCDYRDD